MATAAPSELPTMAKRCNPAASTTASTSLTSASKDSSSTSQSDRPTARGSSRSSVWRRVNSVIQWRDTGLSQSYSTCVSQVGARTSGGPWPASAQAMRVPSKLVAK